MLSDDRPLMRTSQSFPGMRGVIERIRKVFSANPQTFQKMEEENMENDRFLFPRTRKVVRPQELRMTAEMQLKTPRGLSPNAKLMSTTPFQAPMQESLEQDTASSTGHGSAGNCLDSVSLRLNNDSPDLSTTQNSVSYGPGFEPGPSDRQPSPISQAEESVSAHPLTISERLLGLRPPRSNGGSIDLFNPKDAGSSSQKRIGLRTGSSEKGNPSGHLLNDPALQHLQRVIAQNSSPLSVGPLMDDEWAFYKNFNGSWLFDKARSDDIQPSVNILEIRRSSGARDCNSMKLHLDQKHIHILLIINGLGVIDEGRPWTGSIVPSTRRDRRRGGAECWVERYSRGLLLRTRWSGFLAANVFEYLELSSDFMQLIVRQDIIRETGEFCQTKSIWQRRL